MTDSMTIDIPNGRMVVSATDDADEIILSVEQESRFSKVPFFIKKTSFQMKRGALAHAAGELLAASEYVSLPGGSDD